MTEHQLTDGQPAPTDVEPTRAEMAGARTGEVSSTEPARAAAPASRPATRRRRLAIAGTVVLAVALVSAGGVVTYHRLHPAKPADSGVNACGSAGPLAAVRADGGADVPPDEAVRVGTLFKNSRYADLREHGVNVVGLALRVQQYRATDRKVALLYANSMPAEAEALRAACSAHGATLN